MAVFSIQLAVTLVMTSVMSKVLPHLSLARWLLCDTGLRYYLHPSNQQLRDKRKPKGKVSLNEDGSFDINMKHVDVTLERAAITEADAVQLRFYTDYKWLIDFGLCALIVYAFTEAYFYYIPGRDEVNLSMIWCGLLLLFTIKTLLSLTLVYFTSSRGGEAPLVLLFLFLYLFLCLGLLLLPETRLETGLDLAYDAFNASASAFLETHDFSSVGVASRPGVKGVLAVLAALQGACLAFPGLRLGRMHGDAVSQQTSRPLLLLLHTSLLLPLLLLLLWLPQVSRHYLVDTALPGHTRPLLSADAFETCRVLLVLVACLVRALALPLYLQSYLQMANERLQHAKLTQGKLTNLDLQMKITSVFYYLCVVALQVLLPVILCSTLAVMLKTLGGLHWAALGDPRGFVAAECPADLPSPPSPPSMGGLVGHWTEGLDDVRRVLLPEVWRGLLGFWLWWSVLVWFVSGLIGVLYQRFFTTA